MTLQGNGHDIKSQSSYKGLFQSNMNLCGWFFEGNLYKHKKKLMRRLAWEILSILNWLVRTTPTLLLICSSFSRENGHLLLMNAHHDTHSPVKDLYKTRATTSHIIREKHRKIVAKENCLAQFKVLIQVETQQVSPFHPFVYICRSHLSILTNSLGI